MAVCFRTFPPRDVTLALLGLDNSGKSTLLANLTGGTLNVYGRSYGVTINYDYIYSFFLPARRYKYRYCSVSRTLC